MEAVGDPDDDRIDVRIGEHRVVVQVDLVRVVETAEAVCQSFVRVADRLQDGIARLLHRLQMRELRDRAASEDADAEEAVFLLHASLPG